MIYVFDLDGTLCHTPGEDYERAAPLLDRIATVNELAEAGHFIIIDSARGSVTGKDWNAFTRTQLAGWGLRFAVVHTGRKPYANVYVDDRAVSAERFFGNGVAS